MDWDILWWLGLAAITASIVYYVGARSFAHVRLEQLLIWAGFSPLERKVLHSSKDLPSDRIIEGIKARSKRLVVEANFLSEACMAQLSMTLFSNCSSVLEHFVTSHLDGDVGAMSLSYQWLTQLMASVDTCAVMAKEKGNRSLYERLMQWQYKLFMWERHSHHFFHHLRNAGT
jgi:hypothetical protein